MSKQELVVRARRLSNKGYSTNKIAEILDINEATVVALLGL